MEDAAELTDESFDMLELKKRACLLRMSNSKFIDN